MIDASFVGHKFESFDVDIESGRLRHFAKAIGEARAEYVDTAAALARGWPSLPVPPTFLFCLEMEQPDPWQYLQVLGVDLADVLHGEQEIEYMQPVWAGDTVTFAPSIEDLRVKRGGAMELIKKVTHVSRNGTPVAALRSVVVVVHKEDA